jgi:hypothetical protein
VNERNAISHYFDLYPSARKSFLEAVEHVSGRESWITPVATPTTHAVDDLPVVAGAREAADGSIFSETLQEHWRHRLLEYDIISFWGAVDKVSHGS